MFKFRATGSNEYDTSNEVVQYLGHDSPPPVQDRDIIAEVIGSLRFGEQVE